MTSLVAVVLVAHQSHLGGEASGGIGRLLLHCEDAGENLILLGVASSSS